MAHKATRFGVLSAMAGAVAVAAGCGGAVMGDGEVGGGEGIGEVEGVSSALLSSWVGSGAVTDGAAAVGARFGRTVSISTDFAAVTRQALTPADLGTTQAFRRTTSGWVREFTWTTDVDRFPVAVVGAGWLIIGEPCGSLSPTCHGRATGFMRTSTGWFRWVNFGGDAGAAPNFGSVLALDGNSLLIRNGDVVQAFQFGFPLWIATATIAAPPGPYTNTAFGSALALSGARVAVGAPMGERTAGGSVFRSPGFVHVFGAGGTVLEASLTGVGTEKVGSLATVGFGSTVSMVGNRLVAGAPEEVGRQRTAYVFNRQTSGAWAGGGVLAGPTATRTAFAVATNGSDVLLTSSTGATGVAGVARFYEWSRLGFGLSNQFNLSFDWAPAAMSGARAIVGQPQFFSDIGTALTYFNQGPVLAPIAVAQ